MYVMIILLLSIPFSKVMKPELYLDPGSGSFVIQIAIGFIVGSLVVMKAYWAKVRAFFAKDGSNNVANQEGDTSKKDSDQTNG